MRARALIRVDDKSTQMVSGIEGGYKVEYHDVRNDVLRDDLNENNVIVTQVERERERNLHTIIIRNVTVVNDYL